MVAGMADVAAVVSWLAGRFGAFEIASVQVFDHTDHDLFLARDVLVPVLDVCVYVHDQDAAARLAGRMGLTLVESRLAIVAGARFGWHTWAGYVDVPLPCGLPVNLNMRASRCLVEGQSFEVLPAAEPLAVA